MNIFVSSSVDTCLVVATSHVAALWWNWKDAVGVNSCHVTSMVATSSSNLFSQFVHFFFPMLYFALKTGRWKPSYCVSNGMTNGDQAAKLSLQNMSEDSVLKLRHGVSRTPTTVSTKYSDRLLCRCELLWTDFYYFSWRCWFRIHFYKFPGRCPKKTSTLLETWSLRSRETTHGRCLLDAIGRRWRTSLVSHEVIISWQDAAVQRWTIPGSFPYTAQVFLLLPICFKDSSSEECFKLIPRQMSDGIHPNSFAANCQGCLCF